MQRRVRRGGAVVALAIALLVAVACGGDDDGAEGSDPDSRETSTTLMDDESFDAAIDGFTRDVEAAGDDFCAVVDAATLELDTAAANPRQVERTIGLQVKVMESLAGTEPKDEANAAILLRTRQALLDAAEEAGYSPDFLRSPEYSEILGAQEFQSALISYFQRAQRECGLDPGGALLEDPQDGSHDG